MIDFQYIWSVAHPYITHLLFGLFFGFIGYLAVKHYKKGKIKKIKYGIPALITIVALVIFKYYESTLPLNTPIPFLGVTLNTTGDLFVKIARQILTVVAGAMTPLIYEKFLKMKNFLWGSRDLNPGVAHPKGKS
jgi:hypothetical protein